MFLESSRNSQKITCARVSFLMKLQASACRVSFLIELLIKNNFIKREALAQVFSYSFCEISKNTSFTRHLGATASALNTWYEWIMHKTFRGHLGRLLNGHVRSIYVLCPRGMSLSLILQKFLPTGVIVFNLNTL